MEENGRAPATEGRAHRSPAAAQVSQLDAARADLALGFLSVPIPTGKKGPVINEWQQLRLSNEDLPDHFGDGENRGLILGNPSGGLIDVDLDSKEAVALAPAFLPPTERRHGREGKRESHRWYICSDDEIRTRQFKDFDGAMIVELRSSGGQTVVPPSIHPSGEQLHWHADGEPAVVERATIEGAVARLAAAALIARHWPQAGSRHDAALAVAGTLLRGGMPVEEVSHFIAAVAEAAGDDEVEDRVRAAATTAENMETGDEFTARPRLVELLGHEVVERLGKWLGLNRGPVDGVGDPSADSPDIDEAKAQLASFVADAAENGDDAIRRALECPVTLASFAAVAEESPGDYEASIIALRSKVKVKIVESLQRAVRKEGDRVRRERKASDGSDTYLETPQGLIWMRSTADGVTPVRLTNFSAEIITDIQEDDGAETRRSFEVVTELNGNRGQFVVSAAEFPAMNWPGLHLGARAIVYPGFGIRDHARAAIQCLSGDIQSRKIYSHTGWRQFRSGWKYLHAAGAIGENGSTDRIFVELGGTLGGFALPDPPVGPQVRAAVLASLSVLDVVPDHIGFPLLAAAYRAAVCPADFALHFVGKTGTGKTALAAVLQQHWGPTMDARNLPASWSSTANALEAQAFLAKDALLVVDDLAPSGSQHDVSRAHREADRLLRAQGNNSGRGRMRSDSSLRPPKPPRGLILSTGEDIPRGHSIRARALILEISPDEMNWDQLSICQEHARNGLMAQAMARFLQWLAPKYSEFRSRLRRRVQERVRDDLQVDQHRRTPSMIANLYEGLDMFLSYAEDENALSRAEADELWERGCSALSQAAASQDQHHAADDPTVRFVELLTAVIASGKGHVAAPDGGHPTDAAAWGWRRDSVTPHSWRPHGDRIGWLEGNDLYLQPEAAYAAVQKLASEGGEGIAISNQTLRKRLDEKGLLATTDAGRGKLKVRKVLDGTRREVLHLRATSICAKPAQSAQLAHGLVAEQSNLPDGALYMADDDAGVGRLGHLFEEPKRLL